MKQVVKDALWACAAKEHENKALEGLFFNWDRGVAVASDSTLLVTVDIPVGEDSNRLLSRDEKFLPHVYPNISGVFMTAPDKWTRFHVSELIEWCNLVPASPDEVGKRIGITIEGLCFYPPRIRKALKVFEANGERTMLVHVHKDRIWLRGENTNAVVMALLDKTGKAHCEQYTIKQLTDMGELM